MLQSFIANRLLIHVSFIPMSPPSSDFKANLCKRNASPRWLCKIINTTFSSGYFCTVYVWIEHLCYVSTIIKNNKCSPISVRSINHVILYFIKASFDHIIITSIFYYPFVHERIQLQTSEQFSQKDLYQWPLYYNIILNICWSIYRLFCSFFSYNDSFLNICYSFAMTINNVFFIY